MKLVMLGRDMPHEVLFLVLSVVLGINYLIGGAPHDSLAALLDPWKFTAWAALLLFSGTVGLVGCYWRGDVDFSLRLERGALIIQCAVVFLYTIALFDAGGRRAAVAGGVAAVWVAAHVLRVIRITRDLRPAT